MSDDLGATGGHQTQQEPTGGTNTPNDPPSGNQDGATAGPSGKQGDNSNLEGLKAALARRDAKLAEATATIEEMQSKIRSAENSKLSADELRKQTEYAQGLAAEEAKKRKGVLDFVSTYLEQRVDKLPDQYKEIMQAIPMGETDEGLQKYLDTLSKFEGLSLPGMTKAGPQGGDPVKPGVSEVPLEEYDAALMRGDAKAIYAMREKHGSSLDEAIRQRHAKRKG